MNPKSFILPVFGATIAGALRVIRDATGDNVLPTILAVSAVMMVVERLAPGAEMPKVRGRYWSAVLLNLAQLLIVVLAGATWTRWMRGHSLFHMHDYPVIGGAGLTYLVSTFVFYWWHRFRHESEFW